MAGVALDVLVLLVLVFVPALSFIGLFRLIDYVADDELVARVENGEFQSGSPTSRDGTVGTSRSSVTDDPGTDGVRCRTCGAENVDTATYCRNCLSHLS